MWSSCLNIATYISTKLLAFIVLILGGGGGGGGGGLKMFACEFFMCATMSFIGQNTEVHS